MKTLKRYGVVCDPATAPLQNRAKPECDVTRFNRANAFATEGRHEEAIVRFRELGGAVDQFPWLPLNLGASLVALGRWEEAVGAFEWATRTAPNDPLSHGNLGAALGFLGRCEEALPHLCHAVELAPEDTNALLNLVRALHSLRHADAIKVAEMATRLAPENAEAWRCYGDALLLFGASEDAHTAYRTAERLVPGCLDVSNNFGLAMLRAGRYRETVEFFERAIQSRPECFETWAELGLTKLQGGEVSQAVDHLRHSTDLSGENEFIHSNLLLSMCYSPDHSPADLLREAERWGARHTPKGNEYSAPAARNRAKLRIGYLSADFHEHPAGYLYEALFPAHDKSRFEIFAYSTNEWGVDEVTRRIQASVDHWAVVDRDSDEELAARIREDEIDILIDLQGHTPGHRLKALSRHPAPVQATWLGYFGTTGMSQMDYIIGDSVVLPENLERFYTERAARMPGCLYVFQPPNLAVEPTPLPALSNGHLTFGCFNNVAKINPEVVALWGEVLRVLPGSRMILNRWPLHEPEARRRYQDLFASNGVDPARIEFRNTEGRELYFQGYQEVDMMLDTFPFGGGTTTSEALWMGVPVVSLTTDRLPGRMSESILRTVGLPEMVCGDPAAYLRLALELAGDLDRLAELLRTLRGRVVGSPLCDVDRYTRDLESVFESMWANRTP